MRQGDALGLGHAVLRARRHVGHEPFAVLLENDLIDAQDDILGTMAMVQAATGGSVVALMEVEPSEISPTGAPTSSRRPEVRVSCASRRWSRSPRRPAHHATSP